MYVWTGVKVPELFTSLTSSSSSLVIHWLRNGPNAERNVRGWPAESKLRTGAPADAERRGEAGARGVGAKGEGRGGRGTRGTRRQERERRENGRCREGETLDERRERRRRGVKQMIVIGAEKGRRTSHRTIARGNNRF